MPAPLVAAGIPLLSKAIGFAKGLTGLGGIAKGAPAIAGFAKGAAAKRMAGQKIASLVSKMPKGSTAGLNMADDAGMLDKIKRGVTSVEGFKKNMGIPMNKQEMAMMVAPDLLFGGLAAATTEGDLADKALAGAGSAVGGIAGGVGMRGVLGPKSGLGILGTEMVGGIVGDQVGYGVADSIIRAKGGGMTPIEKKQREADALYKQQIMQELGLM